VFFCNFSCDSPRKIFSQACESASVTGSVYRCLYLLKRLTQPPASPDSAITSESDTFLCFSYYFENNGFVTAKVFEHFNLKKPLEELLKGFSHASHSTKQTLGEASRIWDECVASRFISYFLESKPSAVGPSRSTREQ
jgi:hypothetical protein